MSSILGRFRVLRARPVWRAPEPDADIQRPRRSFEQWLEGMSWPAIAVAGLIGAVMAGGTWFFLYNGLGIRWILRLFS